MSDDEVKAGGEAPREDRPPTDEERAEAYRRQLKELRVVDLVRDMMVTLVTVGYEKLGLTDQTRELRDLTDARVAIEALRRLIEVVEGARRPKTPACAPHSRRCSSTSPGWRTPRCRPRPAARAEVFRGRLSTFSRD